MRNPLTTCCVVALLSACSASGPGYADIAQVGEVIESEEARFRIVKVAGPLEHPWSMAFLPSGDILVTERPGRLRIIRDGALQPDPVPAVPEVYARGQGGLLDIALDPEFEANGLIYLSYAYEEGGRTTTRVMRARFTPDGLEARKVVFEGLPRASGGMHFGSRLVFGPDGMLYITMGERGSDIRAQDLSDHAGSILRIRPDGTVPDDNPFVGRDDARPEIWSWGHRNPQGFAVHPETGELFAQEHGPRGGDEINLVKKGANYGWPIITHGVAYSGLPIGEGSEKEGLEQPLWQWTPSIAPSGLTFYTGDAFPGWKGDLFSGALKFQLVSRLEMEDGRPVAEERLIEGEIGRIRDIRQGPDDLLYVLTDEPDGGLYRLEPAD